MKRLTQHETYAPIIIHVLVLYWYDTLQLMSTMSCHNGMKHDIKTKECQNILFLVGYELGKAANEFKIWSMQKN